MNLLKNTHMIVHLCIIFKFHLVQPGVSVIQDVLNRFSLLLLHLKLLLLKIGHVLMKLKDKSRTIAMMHIFKSSIVFGRLLLSIKKHPNFDSASANKK